MPFLIVQKNATDWPKADEALLAARLCPYAAPIQVVEHGRARIYFSSLARVTKQEESAFLTAPVHGGERDLRPKAANTAFANVRIGLLAAPEIATDPLGQMPMWRAETAGFTLFGPEVKAFCAIAGFSPEPRADRQVLANERRDRFFSPYTNVVRHRSAGLSPAFAPALAALPRAEAGRALAAALRVSAAEAPDEAPGEAGRWACFLSGGIDSSIAASLLKKRSPARLTAWTLGTELANEFADAADAARHLQMDHRQVMLKKEALASLWWRVIFCNEVFDGMSAEILVQLLALVEAAASTANQVMTGYGADLLFGGMLRHAAYLSAVGVSDTAGLIERTRWSMELSPFYSWAQGVAQTHVFLHPGVVSAAMAIHSDDLFDASSQTEKVLLRQIAVDAGWLANAQAFRPKLGMTSGSRVNELVSEHLGLSGVYAYDKKTAAAWRVLKHIVTDRSATVQGEGSS